MSTNVYRMEEVIYFGGNQPIDHQSVARHQGYFLSTTTDCCSKTYPEQKTWETLEGRARAMFPKCDPIRMAGFAFMLINGEDGFSEDAADGLSAELEEATGGEGLDDIDIWDLASRIVYGGREVPTP